MMRHLRLFPLMVGCALTLSCQNAQQRSGGSEPPAHSYLQLLERLEVAGNRYRRATDLLKYSSSSLERSLADSHLQLARQFLESEFELADVESKSMALNEAGTSESTAAPTAAEQSQYDTIAAEVWRLSAEVEEAKERLAAARQNLKRAATADAFRKAQQKVDQLQKEVDIADKKLDLAGSNLDIQDYKRKRSTPGSSGALSFSDRLKMMKDELFPRQSLWPPLPSEVPSRRRQQLRQSRKEASSLACGTTSLGGRSSKACGAPSRKRNGW